MAATFGMGGKSPSYGGKSPSFRGAQPVSHQFQRREEETWAQTFASAANVCRVCKRPFLGGLLGHALQCRGCSFIACHSCAANQADWDTRTFGCTTGRTAKTYLDFDLDEQEEEEVALPAGAVREHAAAMRRHDLLWDCIQELRASTRRYHAALNASFAEYKKELAAAMPLASPGAPTEADADVPQRLRELLRERLAGVTAVLAEQAAAAAELTRQVQVHDAHDGDSSSRSGSAVVSGLGGARELVAPPTGIAAEVMG
ncbi:hypothetical protein T484DRAFT_1905329, partial [Baffinella frigidus]